MTSDQLVRRQVSCPHVVVLGAGASLAAFPNGDARGRRLPLMNNLVEVLGLRPLVEEAGHDADQNFEELYSKLHTADPNSVLVKQIERRVRDYFGSLKLPRHLTIYDLLLLSLREKDAIFTFNWDPFLADAVARNVGEAPLPHIFHLHGNVRVFFCADCHGSMPNTDVCPACNVKLIPTPLLYPIEEKDYASDPFIKTQWDAVREFIKRAAIITIFGYSAPESDQEAMAVFTRAWKSGDQAKLIERLEIIDIRGREELAHQWSPFAHFNDHYDTHASFYDSSLSSFPRRTCEALAESGINGGFVEPIPWAGNLAGVQESIAKLVEAEGSAALAAP